MILFSRRSSPLHYAKASFSRLGSSRSGTSRLRDFHSIEFRPADIPVWLTASRERLLRAPRPLRLRLRCQKTDRCRSASGCVAALHNPRLTDAVHWLQAGKTVDIVRFASKIHRLASAFRTASATSWPAAWPALPPCGGPTTDVSPLTRTCHRSGFRTPVGCADIPLQGNFRPHGRCRRSSCCRCGL